MLVLSRRESERIRLGNSIVVTVIRVAGDRVRLGIEAPKEIPVHRQEVYEAIRREQERARQAEVQAEQDAQHGQDAGEANDRPDPVS